MAETIGVAFPYVRWCAIHDARTPAQHRLLESLGINSTDVYRFDDPALAGWRSLRRRWEKRGRSPCRCGWINMSAESVAERYGITAPSWVRPFDFDPWDNKLMGKCRNS